MKQYINRYHLTVFAISLVILLLSYFINLKFIDSMLINYDVISATSSLTDDPNSLDRRIELLQEQLKNKQQLLETLKDRKPFYTNLFTDLGEKYRCELTQLETSQSPKNNNTQYRVVYSGKIKRLMNLLNTFETKYYVNVQKAGLNADASDGSIVRMLILMQAGAHE
ncbi:MAG: hypothetical protein KAR42_08500 [candidate division Zixibacteria bacterium]|nr:hypothetical protein [candidate division Zixibacteria bacterium]